MKKACSCSIRKKDERIQKLVEVNRDLSEKLVRREENKNISIEQIFVIKRK